MGQAGAFTVGKQFECRHDGIRVGAADQIRELPGSVEQPIVWDDLVHQPHRQRPCRIDPLPVSII